MAKDRRLEIRIDSNTLDAFDDVVGLRNRSRVIIKLMEKVILKSGKYYIHGKDNIEY